MSIDASDSSSKLDFDDALRKVMGPPATTEELLIVEQEAEAAANGRIRDAVVAKLGLFATDEEIGAAVQKIKDDVALRNLSEEEKANARVALRETEYEAARRGLPDILPTSQEELLAFVDQLECDGI